MLLNTIVRCGVAAVFSLQTLVAGAVDIVGDWAGTWQQPGFGAGTVTMNLRSQSDVADLYMVDGFLTLTCDAPALCSGYEAFLGTFDDDGRVLKIDDQAVGDDNVSVVMSHHEATLSADGRVFSGTFNTLDLSGCAGCTWAVTRVQLAEPVPLSLTVLGMAAMAFLLRRR